MSKDYDTWKTKQAAGSRLVKDFFLASKITTEWPARFLSSTKTDTTPIPNADPFRRYVDKQGTLKNLVIGNF